MQKEGGYRNRDISDIWLTGIAKLTPVRHMTFNLDYSFNVKDTEEMDYRRQIAIYDKVGVSGYYPYTNPSSVTRTSYNNKYYVFNAYADYENTFNEKHYFKAMIGLLNSGFVCFWIPGLPIHLLVSPAMKTGEDYRDL